MSKFMNTEERDQALKELMTSVRNNTLGSKCIDIFEILLNEVEDKDVVDTAIVDMSRFVGEFSRLCHDIDRMQSKDYMAKMLTVDFISPAKWFTDSKKLAKTYLALDGMLKEIYPTFKPEGKRKIVLAHTDCLGMIDHPQPYTAKEYAFVTTKFGKLYDLKQSEIADFVEQARKVVLLWNYMPAIVKAFIQTKRRSLGLDRNSTKY